MLPLFKSNSAFQQIKNSMQAIGYQDDLLVENCEYADVLSKEYEVKLIKLAGFARTPRSYRNACIGVIESNGDYGASAVIKNRGLGAPLIFELTPKTLERWKVTEKGEPEWKESVPHNQIANFFERNASLWEPDRIFRAKIIGDVDEVRQLDFFDAGLLTLLEGQIHKKLDVLLRETLKKIEDAYQKYGHIKPDFEDVYRVVFRFIVAKVMSDRNHSIGIKTNDASEVLATVESYYNLQNKALYGVRNRDRILDVAWKAISGEFHFQNISVDDFAFIYESSLVTPETRKHFGTHITPPRIAEYITQKLPFENLDLSERFLFEPCSGHGGFLVAGLRRLRELVPKTFSNEERHIYLTEKISAIEIEPFALEACWSRLVLADYPYPNGWKLIQGDVFKDKSFEIELVKSRILLCNPPFEDFTLDERKYYKNLGIDTSARKPIELLKRIMQFPPALLGLVLPQSFESGASYAPFHKQLAETYDSIELVSLPEIFNYSDATPTLVLASGKREHYASVSVVCRKIGEGEEKENFLRGLEPTGAKVTYSIEDYLKPKFSLWQPPLSRIWDYLKGNQTLSEIAVLHRGLCWRGQKNIPNEQKRDLILDEWKDGYERGCAKVSGNFEQYSISANQFLSLKEQDQYDNAYQLPWDKPKVVCNAARLRRSAWRLGAVADVDGIALSQRFLAIWVKDNFSLFSIAALLNSPLSNAFLYSHEDGRDNHIRTVKSIPLPNISTLRINGEIDNLSKDLHKLIEKNDLLTAKETLLKIDAEILRAYDLPPYLERELLDLFQGILRPVPFHFDGYYPKDFRAYFPLHEVISETFQLARADRLLKRLPSINDKDLAEHFDSMFGYAEDE